jgi:DNA-binding phage protein
VSNPAGSLEEVFLSFTGGAHEMEGKTFAKVAKDCALLDKKLSATDMDLIFAKIKTKAARKITYAQFQKGVEEMAKKKGVTFEQLSETICSKGGPTFTGTKAEAVKYHDDKSLYTGVHG